MNKDSMELSDEEVRRRDIIDDMFVLAMQNHEAGQYEESLHICQEILKFHPDHAETLHLAGILAYKFGNYEFSVEFINKAISKNPSATYYVNLGNTLKRLGNFNHAKDSYQKALKLKPDHLIGLYNYASLLKLEGDLEGAMLQFLHVVELRPDFVEAHNELGNIFYQKGNLQVAASCYQRAIELKPAYADAYCNLGLVYNDLDDLEQAERYYHKSIEINTNHVAAYYGLGNLCLAQSKLRDAELSLQAAINLDPDHVGAQCNLGNVYQKRGKHLLALECYEKVLAKDAYYLKAHHNIGYTYLEQGNLAKAQAKFNEIHHLKHEPKQSYFDDEAVFSTISAAKIRHDIEQLTYLMDEDLIDSSFTEAIAVYQELAHFLQADFDKQNIVEIPVIFRKRLKPYYNRIIHMDEGNRVKHAVNPKLDRKAIETDYHGNGPGMTYVDQILTDEAIQKLYEFCLRSTIWYEFKYPNGYLGAFIYDGFSCELLAQISEELPSALPGIFQNNKLLHWWAFKCDSQMTGLNKHADFAAVNVNFWLTPDKANLDPEHGGLIVWDKEAPSDWHFQKYNNDQAAINQFIEASGARPTTVPYRRNRALIFNSDLFHETDVVNFKDGYANRRLNVTMLYGKRAGKIT